MKTKILVILLTTFLLIYSALTIFTPGLTNMHALIRCKSENNIYRLSKLSKEFNLYQIVNIKYPQIKGTCIQVYKDGGKACRSGSECLSKKCVIEGIRISGIVGDINYDEMPIPEGRCMLSTLDFEVGVYSYINEEGKIYSITHAH